MLDLKINHLQLLAQIVSTGSLTEAAQNLGLSAAAASRMLKKLQTEMNDPLFIRVWRGLTPTDTTTMMLPVVRELLEQMERLEYQKSFTPAKLSATITIGAADNSVISILPPVVRAIREQAPKVNFRILPLESRQFQKLADGGMDFLLYPTQNLPDLPTHFLGLNLFRIERSVLMNRAHPLIKAYEAGQTLKAEDFRKYPRILVKLLVLLNASARRISTATCSASSREITSSLPEAIPRLSTSHTPTKKLGMMPVLAPICL